MQGGHDEWGEVGGLGDSGSDSANMSDEGGGALMQHQVGGGFGQEMEAEVARHVDLVDGELEATAERLGQRALEALRAELTKARAREARLHHKLELEKRRKVSLEQRTRCTCGDVKEHNRRLLVVKGRINRLQGKLQAINLHIGHLQQMDIEQVNALDVDTSQQVVDEAQDDIIRLARQGRMAEASEAANWAISQLAQRVTTSTWHLGIPMDMSNAAVAASAATVGHGQPQTAEDDDDQGP